MRGTKREDGEAGLKGILMRSCARAQTRGREEKETSVEPEGVCAEKPGDPRGAAPNQTYLWVYSSQWSAVMKPRLICSCLIVTFSKTKLELKIFQG